MLDEYNLILLSQFFKTFNMLKNNTTPYNYKMENIMSLERLHAGVIEAL